MKRTLSWLAVAVWFAVIFAFSHQAHSGAVTEEYLHDYNVPVRKLAHVTEFAIMFTLIRLAVSVDAVKRHWSSNRLNMIAYFLTLACACFDEWHQSMVPGRSATLSDTVVDSFGAMIAWIIFYLIQLKRKDSLTIRDRQP
jgi:VanZ family protein